MDLVSQLLDPAIWSEQLLPILINLVLAVLVFLVGRWVARRITMAIKNAMQRAGADETLIGFLGNIIYTVLLVAVVIAALEQVGIETTSLLALLAAAGLAVGLALKDSLSNFSAGVMLIIYQPFKTGDFVEAGGVSGVVEAVNIFNTVMRTGDNREMIVPNSQIFGGPITNYSVRDTRRIDLVIGIGYGDDIGRARDILMDIMHADERVLDDPEPVILVDELADSSVNLAVRPWVAAGDYGPTRSDLLERFKTGLEAEGLSIPFPQRDVYVHKQS